MGTGFSRVIMETGVTATRLLTIGMPNSFSIDSPVLTRFSAVEATLSYTFCAVRAALSPRSPERFMPG